jgi:hypothetical protein
MPTEATNPAAKQSAMGFQTFMVLPPREFYVTSVE